MPALTLSNFGIYLLQVAALTAVGAWLPAIVGLAAPRARMIYYRTLLVVALGLPLLRPVAPPQAAGSPAPAVEVAARVSVAAPPEAPTRVMAAAPMSGPSGTGLPRVVGPTVAAVIVVGLFARLTWVAGGLLALGRLRRDAVSLEPRPVPVEQAVSLAAADADIRLSDAITHPVSFGARRPAVLLPRSLRAYPDAEQRAVACHELIHVRRHDWLRTVGDEIVRAVFWFHPAIWWLLDQIHLSREQVVDQEVVEITGSRRPYLDALVKLARPATRPALRPASLFLRRAHLPQRVALLLKEVSMSKTRLVGGLVVSIGVVLAAGGLAVWALPLQASAAAASTAATPAGDQQATKPGTTAPGQQASKPGMPTAASAPRIITKIQPIYPPDAKAKRVQGVVILETRISPTGEVTGVKVLRSVPMLDQAAIDAVRQWRFEPPSVEMITTMTLRFALDDEAQAVTGGVTGGVVGGVSGGVQGGVVGGVPPGGTGKTSSTVRGLKRAKAVYPVVANAEGADAIAVLAVTIGADGLVTDARGVTGSAALWGAAIDAVRQWEFEPADHADDCLIGFNLGAGAPGPSAGTEPVRVGGSVRQPTKVRDVRPVYPEEARANGVQGVVIVEARVGPNGKVTDGRVLRSIPGLDTAALEAVLQWEFTPTLVNGVPAPVIMTVTVNFTLG